MSGGSADRDERRLTQRDARWLLGMEGFLGSWRFAVVALAVLVGWTLFLSAILVLPAPAGAAGEVARQFKVWCLGFDPATGSYDPIWALMLYLDPLMLAAVVAGIWWRPLRAAWRARGWRPILRWGGLGVALVLLAGAGLGLSAFGGKRVDPDAPHPFPATALRTELPAPSFAGLTDHRGRTLRAGELDGRVVLATAVYACCTTTCPLLLDGARQAVDALTPGLREDLAVIGVTMDPERDGPGELARLAEGYGLDDGTWRLLTGQRAEVAAVLDAMSVARTRDPETGVIDHANVYVLIDRQGRVAYRLSLPSARQRHWLGRALETLLREPGPLDHDTG